MRTKKTSLQTISDNLHVEDFWLNELEKNLQKNAVKTKEQDDYLFNQLNSILNRNSKSKFSSVNEVVEDMKNRSGLTAYLDKIKLSEKNITVKKASSTEEPIIFSKHPEIKKTIENYVNSTSGYMSIPAILQKVMTLYKSDVLDLNTWEDPALVKFISRLNLEAKSKNVNPNYSNLGIVSDVKDFSPENTDAWHHLMPSIS